MSAAVGSEKGAKSVEIWRRIVGPDRPTYSPETARAILELDFDSEDHRRIAELSSRSGQGALSAAERAELEGYVEINDILVFLQSKARLSLKQAGLGP